MIHEFKIKIVTPDSIDRKDLVQDLAESYGFGIEPTEENKAQFVQRIMSENLLKRIKITRKERKQRQNEDAVNVELQGITTE